MNISLTTDQNLDESSIRGYTQWFRYFGIFCIIICGLFPIFILLNFFSGDNFLYQKISNFFTFSILPALTGAIAYSRIDSSLSAIAAVDKVKKISRYFLTIWIIGLALLPFIVAIAMLGHIDCGFNCSTEVTIFDKLPLNFLLFWFVFPFALWLYSFRLLKIRLRSSDKKLTT